MLLHRFLLHFLCHTLQKSVYDNYNLKSHNKRVHNTYQPDTKANTNPNPNPYPTTKQQTIVNVQRNY